MSSTTYKITIEEILPSANETERKYPQTQKVYEQQIVCIDEKPDTSLVLAVVKAVNGIEG